MELCKAVEILQDELLKDKEYRDTWQANIVMAFVDIFPIDVMEYEKLHKLANEGADNFLQLLCRKTGPFEAEKGGKLMAHDTAEKLIEVLRYFAQMTTSPEWISQFIDDIEKDLIAEKEES